MKTLRTCRGVGLVEVLVTLVIIAVGLLGLLSLETRANQAEMESYQRAQALILVMDMVHRIEANRNFASCYVLSNTSYAALGTGTTFTPTGCSANSDADLGQWNNLLQGSSEIMGGAAATTSVGAMLNARGCISLDTTTNQYTVEVAWQGLAASVAPTDTCGQGQYGNDALRRTVSYTFALPNLSNP